MNRFFGELFGILLTIILNFIALIVIVFLITQLFELINHFNELVTSMNRQKENLIVKTVDMIADMLNLQANYDDIVCKTQGIDLYKINYEDFPAGVGGRRLRNRKTGTKYWKNLQMFGTLY